MKKNDKNLVDTIGVLFDNLRLTQTNSPLVTFSKTMHFFLPDLFMPIDRKYTLQFFYKNPPYKQKDYAWPWSRENQRQCFFQVFEQFRLYANENREMLEKQVNPKSRWNRNIPKIIDNIIIAQVTRSMER